LSGSLRKPLKSVSNELASFSGSTPWLPQLDEAVPFAQLLPTITDSARFIAHLPDTQTPPALFQVAPVGQPVTVLIGPEGDFSPTELQQAQDADFQVVTLGANRLRTETAALVALLSCRVAGV
jgi:16S rRNA (uracil1498-N3)-methyltransferase